MAEYKRNDKVVFKIDEDDASDMNKGYGPNFYYDQALGKLEDFQQVERKIKFNFKEKQEFDELKTIHKSLFLAFDTIAIDSEKYPNLFYRLFGNTTDDEEHCKAQIEFTKAWEKPNRIEVVGQKKYNIKLNTHIPLLNDMYLYRNTDINGKLSFEFGDKEYNDTEDQQWTEQQAKKYGLSCSNPSFLFEEVSE